MLCARFIEVFSSSMVKGWLLCSVLFEPKWRDFCSSLVLHCLNALRQLAEEE